MKGRTLTDAQISSALRAHLPKRAYPGLRERILDAAETTPQQRALPSFLGGIGAADPINRWRTLLIAAALLIALALASAAAVGALRQLLRDPVPNLTLGPTPSPASDGPTPSPVTRPTGVPTGVWIATGTMVTPRYGHSAVPLLDGRVLVVGGSGDESEPATAELYDPASGTWSTTGNMLKPRSGFPPTLLLDGRVLVGHRDDVLARTAPAADVVTIGSEVYDPESGTWSSAGKVSTLEEFGADGFAATLLRDGTVLVSGPTGAQLYDPDSGTWSATGTMITPRHDHTATLLRDGKVLVAGGRDSSLLSCDQSGCGYPPAGEAELYDPDTGSWTAIANTPTLLPGRPQFGDGWASLLQDGTVLLMSDSANLYDPTSGTWSTPAAPREPGNPVALLPDDTVLLAVEGPPPSCTTAALYDPRTGTATPASNMLRCVSAVGQPPLFTLLRDGTVLVAGGSVCNNDGDGVCVATGAAELYIPAGVSPPPFDFPSPAPPVFPSPTPRPTPFPPAAGPVPPNARSWTVTVDNKSSEPATLFVAELDEGGNFRLVGSATPNVVPAGATVKVTFLFPAKGAGDGWIYVNPRPGEGGALVNAADIGIPGKIVITADGQEGWLSP